MRVAYNHLYSGRSYAIWLELKDTTRVDTQWTA